MVSTFEYLGGNDRGCFVNRECRWMKEEQPCGLSGAVRCGAVPFAGRNIEHCQEFYSLHSASRRTGNIPLEVSSI